MFLGMISLWNHPQFLTVYMVNKMCDYVKVNQCTITGEVCPFMYFCERKRIWKPNKNMPSKCKVALNIEVPDGYCRVVGSRKNFLYIDMGDYTISVKNPFDEVPLYVRVSKTKNGYKIRK